MVMWPKGYRCCAAVRPLSAPPGWKCGPPIISPSWPGHVSAGPREHLAELAADVAAADHQQRSRQPLEVEGRRARQIGNTLDARDQRQRGGSTCGDDHLAGVHQLSVDHNAVTRESGPALEKVDAIIFRQQVDVLLLPQR